jgi:hypothetical protein
MPKKQNMLVVPVHSNNRNVKLADLIPYQNGMEEIRTDNSSDFEDDFSIAGSVINFNGDIKNLQNLQNFAHLREHDFGTKTIEGAWTTRSPPANRHPDSSSSMLTEDNEQERILKIEQTIKKMKKRAQLIMFTEKQIPNIASISQGELSNIVYQKIK